MEFPKPGYPNVFIPGYDGEKPPLVEGVNAFSCPPGMVLNQYVTVHEDAAPEQASPVTFELIAKSRLYQTDPVVRATFGYCRPARLPLADVLWAALQAVCEQKDKILKDAIEALEKLPPQPIVIEETHAKDQHPDR